VPFKTNVASPKFDPKKDFSYQNNLDLRWRFPCVTWQFAKFQTQDNWLFMLLQAKNKWLGYASI
jgi:hypothetical protein